MLIVRLTRVGKSKQPYFRIVVADHHRAVKSKFVEILGNYNPRTKELVINKEKLAEWQKKGAQVSDTVAFIVFGKQKPLKAIKKVEEPVVEKAAESKEVAPEGEAAEPVAETTEEPKAEAPAEEAVVSEEPKEEEAKPVEEAAPVAAEDAPSADSVN